MVQVTEMMNINVVGVSVILIVVCVMGCYESTTLYDPRPRPPTPDPDPRPPSATLDPRSSSATLDPLRRHCKTYWRLMKK